MTTGLTYPGAEPGKATLLLNSEQAVLENAVLRCAWTLTEGRIAGLTVENRQSGQVVSTPTGHLPRLRLADNREIDLAAVTPITPFELDGKELRATFRDQDSGLELQWSVSLSDDANAVIQSVSLVADADVQLQELVFMESPLAGARQIGEVDGSVVVCGDIFMAIEHPLAKNLVATPGHVRCALLLGSTLAAGESRTYTSVFGVVPSGQLRRGFMYYLEMRRVHPYRQFLHYNNWYDVVLSRSTERLTEPEALAAIEYFGRELVEKRGVKMDAVVWDDGWDDLNTLWDFHKGFPNGFRNLMVAGEKYGLAQGVWMSPNGGYAWAKAARLAYGEPLGYETNENGYAMGGAKYRKAFHAACLKMMRDNGVVFFKFDGLGEGGSGKDHTDGTTGCLSNDIHAILELSRDLHREDPDVHVSATAGTWASPFWMLYADNIWRQGGDTGHHGAGDTRQQWITYRDMFCYERVVQVGPLCPINSVMQCSVVIGDRPGRAPAGMVLDEKSVADEVWSFFGSGCCLQELYVSPGVPTDTMLDQIADAAKWSRSNEATQVDSHWVGGNPGQAEVYGWASWQPGKGILVLRNPSEETQTFAGTLRDVLDLPAGEGDAMALTAIYPQGREVPAGAVDVSATLTMTLEPFATVVLELV